MFPVTQAFIPLLEKSSIGGGRIVNVSRQLASTQTDMNGHNAKFGPVEAATLPSEGPSGLFFDPKKQSHP